MDEPTAPLTTNEVEILFGIVEKLRKKGCDYYILIYPIVLMKCLGWLTESQY